MSSATFTASDFIKRMKEEGDERVFTKDFLKISIFFFFK